MNADLHDFPARVAGTFAVTLVPVVLIALLSMPPSLGRHPGEPPLDADALAAHMTRARTLRLMSLKRAGSTGSQNQSMIGRVTLTRDETAEPR